MKALARRHARRNFLLGVLNGVFFNAGSSFSHPHTVVPAFVGTLTGSPFLIGLASSIDVAGWSLPQVFAARIASSRRRKKPIYNTLAAVRSAATFAIPAAILLLGDGRPSLLLGVYLFFLVVYSTAGGLSGVPFLDIFARTVPAERRGAFWGSRLFWGGTLSFLSGFAVEAVLRGVPSPLSYAILFGISAFFYSVAMFVYSFVVEPAGEARPPLPLLPHLRRSATILRRDPQFALLYGVRVCMALWAMGVPFFTVYARQRAGLPESVVGRFLSAYMAGLVLSNLVWARLSDRPGGGGNREVLRRTAWTALAAPLLLILGTEFGGMGRLPLYAAFFLAGAVLSGSVLGFQNRLLEIAPEEERLHYVGFMNSLVGPALLLPAVGGLVVTASSYELLFGVCVLASIAAAVGASRMAGGAKKPLKWL